MRNGVVKTLRGPLGILYYTLLKKRFSLFTLLRSASVDHPYPGNILHTNMSNICSGLLSLNTLIIKNKNILHTRPHMSHISYIVQAFAMLFIMLWIPLIFPVWITIQVQALAAGSRLNSWPGSIPVCVCKTAPTGPINTRAKCIAGSVCYGNSHRIKCSYYYICQALNYLLNEKNPLRSHGESEKSSQLWG